MSGTSGSQRTFDTLNKTITNASDYIQRKRDATRWANLANDVKVSNSGNPRKKNGSYYQNNYFVNLDPNSTTPANRKACVASARNYELLQSISRGKYFVNPVLNGSQSANFGIWVGNVLEIKYQEGCRADGTQCGNYNAPIRLTNLYNSSATTSPYWSGPTGYDFMPFPNACVNDCSYNGLVPGFVIDPSNTIFYRNCLGSSGSATGTAGNRPSWLNHAKIQFRDTKYYWKGVNAQPLAGYSFPAKVPLYFQGPNVDDDQFAPVINATDASYSEVLLEEWCSGLYAIN